MKLRNRDHFMLAMFADDSVDWHFVKSGIVYNKDKTRTFDITKDHPAVQLKLKNMGFKIWKSGSKFKAMRPDGSETSADTIEEMCEYLVRNIRG